MRTFSFKKQNLLFFCVSALCLSACNVGSLEMNENKEFAEAPPADYSTQSTSQLRLANRNYLAAEFFQIFGNSSQVDINNFITKQISTLSGPCEIYSSTTNIYAGCENDSSNTHASILAADTTPYAAYVLVRACDAVLGKGNGSLAFASAQVIQRIGSYLSLSPNDDEIKRVWEQFNPGDSLTEELLVEFRNLILSVKQKGYPLTEEWRFLYLVNCYNAGRLVP